MYEAVLILSMIVGVALIVYSIVLYSRSGSEGNSASNYFEAANTMKFVEASLEEINNTMDELGETSKFIFDEMEKKYQELLILYSLIDQKKQEVAGSYSAVQAPGPQDDHPTQPYRGSPHMYKVRKLQEEGVSVEDTAKRLGIGKGEVQLLRELGKNSL